MNSDIRLMEGGAACIRDVIRWEIIITVAFSISFFSSLRILLSVSVSTADRESSNTRIEASFISILAIATRCFCPPDKGVIQQMGTHEELIHQEGPYKDIYEIQMNSDIRLMEGGAMCG